MTFIAAVNHYENYDYSGSLGASSYFVPARNTIINTVQLTPCSDGNLVLRFITTELKIFADRNYTGTFPFFVLDLMCDGNSIKIYSSSGGTQTLTISGISLT